jgi:hypothetical protein
MLVYCFFVFLEVGIIWQGVIVTGVRRFVRSFVVGLVLRMVVIV